MCMLNVTYICMVELELSCVVLQSCCVWDALDQHDDSMLDNQRALLYIWAGSNQCWLQRWLAHNSCILLSTCEVVGRFCLSDDNF